jgi:hypothetical protein
MLDTGMNVRKLGTICALLAATPNLIGCESSRDSPDRQFQKQVKRAQEIEADVPPGTPPTDAGFPTRRCRKLSIDLPQITSIRSIRSARGAIASRAYRQVAAACAVTGLARLLQRGGGANAGRLGIRVA